MRKTTSTNSLNRTALFQACTLNYTLDIIGGRWRAQTLMYITAGSNRFSQLKEHLPGISDQVLGRTLRELEGAGLLTKEVLPEPASHVTYHPTAAGEALRPLLQQLCDWGKEFQPAAATAHTA
jgi:DNA-binding HxlR family transcriptional regulator